MNYDKLRQKDRRTERQKDRKIASSSLAKAQHCSDSIAFKAGVLFFKLVEKGFYPVIKVPNMLGERFYEHEWMSTFCICLCFHMSLYLCL